MLVVFIISIAIPPIINISFNSYLKFKDLKQRALIGNFTVPKLPVFNMVIKGNDKYI